MRGSRLLLIPGAVLSATAACAAEFSGYGVLTTDYVFRGVTQSDGHAAAQLGGEISFDSGFHAGVWASTVDIETAPGRQRDAELDIYAGYALPLNADWTLGMSAIAYTYPGQEGPVDYNYEELMLSVNYADRAWFEFAYTPDLYSSGFSARNFDLYTEWPAGRHLIVSAGAGYYDLSDWFDDGYGYWQLGVTWPIGRIDLDLRYHDTNGWVPLVSSDDRAGARAVFSVRLSF